MLRACAASCLGGELALAGRLGRHDPRHGSAAPRHQDLRPGCDIAQDAGELLIGLPCRHGFLHQKPPLAMSYLT
jgi:hypothetical protein